MIPAIKVLYFVDSNKMTDEEFENQQEKVFVITMDMIKDYVMEKDTSFNKRNEFIHEIRFEISKS